MNISQAVVGMEVKIVPGPDIISYLEEKWGDGEADEWEHVPSVSYAGVDNFVQSVLALTFVVVSISSHDNKYPVRISPDINDRFDLAMAPKELRPAAIDYYKDFPLLTL